VSEFLAAGADEDAFACALCGLRFTHGGQVCASCPIGAGCDDLVRCPRCGYQFPRRSRIASWIAALWARRRRPRAPAASHPVRTLAALRAGETGLVIAVSGAEPALRMKLSHLGLLPGAEVAVQQSRPATVVRVGETTVALQRTVAAAVHVRVGGEALPAPLTRCG
jgi:Fe2+ transport system protein FeoA